MASTEFIDPYLDPDTGLLRNKVGATTREGLDRAESDLSWLRLLQILDHPPSPTGDLAELCAIHRRLFQDVYDWAGQVRTVDIRKNVDGAAFFLPCSRIGTGSQYAADELRADNNLHGMSRDRFVERLAYHYEQFNHIHPFREGNGRTQRLFWNRIARDAGWQLDWLQVQGSVNDNACRAAAETNDLRPLQAMFDRITAKVPAAGERDATWKTAERRRLALLRDAGDLVDRIRDTTARMRATRDAYGLPNRAGAGNAPEPYRHEPPPTHSGGCHG